MKLFANKSASSSALSLTVSKIKRCLPGSSSIQSSWLCRAGSQRPGDDDFTCAAARPPNGMAAIDPSPVLSRVRNERRWCEDGFELPIYSIVQTGKRAVHTYLINLRRSHNRSKVMRHSTVLKAATLV